MKKSCLVHVLRPIKSNMGCINEILSGSCANSVAPLTMRGHSSHVMFRWVARIFPTWSTTSGSSGWNRGSVLRKYADFARLKGHHRVSRSSNDVRIRAMKCRMGLYRSAYSGGTKGTRLRSNPLSNPTGSIIPSTHSR